MEALNREKASIVLYGQTLLPYQLLLSSALHSPCE